MYVIVRQDVACVLNCALVLLVKLIFKLVCLLLCSGWCGKFVANCEMQRSQAHCDVFL